MSDAPAAAQSDIQSAVLGVEKSLGGRRWHTSPSDERTALALAQRLGVPEIIARVLAARGLGTEDAETFLEPTLRDLLPDPSHLKDMDSAAEWLAAAVIQGERIAVFGDYDVDGATSAALLRRFFAAVGSETRVYVPDRLTEGYGPNTEALLRLRSEGASVVLTVDCGTASFEPLSAAAAAGLDVIVVDHHVAEARLPQATAVINPNRLDQASPYGHLAAVGVAFLLVVAVNRTLRRAGWYRDRREPNLLEWLDLVALGTVCDAVALTGINRALVAQGLKVLARRGNTGLAALADVARLDRPPGAYHAGFILGPRINAGGRIGEAGLGARLLACDDTGEATAIALRLDELNRERQEIEAAVLAAALDQAAQTEASADHRAPIVFAYGEGWHPGVVGIVASRLAERFGRPACVVSLDGDQGTGSGRSVPGSDLGAAVVAARQKGLLVKGGGHPMAAGFTVERQRLAEVRDFLVDRLADSVAAADRIPGLHIDGVVSVGGASADLAAQLSRLEPFGAGNPEPRFAVTGARLVHVAPVGRDHLQCALAGEGSQRLDAIAFRCLETPLGAGLRNNDGRPLHVAGKLRENTWRGRTKVQLVIDDAAPAIHPGD